MIETAYVDSSRLLRAVISGTHEEKMIRYLNRGRLQGYTANSVSYIDDSGWLKVWYESGNEETVRYVGL